MKILFNFPMILTLLIGCQPAAMNQLPEPALISHTYIPSDLLILNPERGFFLAFQLPGPVDFSSLRDQGITLVHLNVHLDEWREMGDRGGIAGSLNNRGNVALAQIDYPAARGLYEESLALGHEIGDKSDMAYALFVLGLADLAEHRPEAREHMLHSLHLRQELGKQIQQTSSLIVWQGWFWRKASRILPRNCWARSSPRSRRSMQ